MTRGKAIKVLVSEMLGRGGGTETEKVVVIAAATFFEPSGRGASCFAGMLSCPFLSCDQVRTLRLRASRVFPRFYPVMIPCCQPLLFTLQGALMFMILYENSHWWVRSKVYRY